MKNDAVIDSITKQSYIIIPGTDSAEETRPGFETTFTILPNPSFGETTINYSLSHPSPVQIRITDVLGIEVSSWSLNDQAGEHSLLWNTDTGAGMYYCTFSVQGIIKTLPFVKLK
ncbi:MAG: T9SS type A sorting domain-containing protein [Ignavibacteriae bacterium]|nr:T9SS type A sorting domain-containing protein [Ignavibacteriota bacterium]